MFKVVFTFFFFFFIILAELALYTVLLICELAFSTYNFIWNPKKAEWLWRGTPDQTFVGSSPLTDGLFFSVPDIFF